MVTTVLVSVAAVVFGLGFLGLGATAVYVYLLRSRPVIVEPQTAVEVRVAALEVSVAGLPSLWEDERARSKRDKDRALAAERSVEEKLAELEERTAAGEDVLTGDGEGGAGSGMLHLQPRLGQPHEPGIHERAAAVEHLLR